MWRPDKSISYHTKQGRYTTVPWCRFFIPKIASPDIKPGDPDINDHVMYAKCIKGHVIRDAADWVLCENLPSPEATCWQEGGDTLFSLQRRQRAEAKEAKAKQSTTETTQKQNQAVTQVSKS